VQSICSLHQHVDLRPSPSRPLLAVRVHDATTDWDELACRWRLI
jgi:gamma-glutamyl:cysteine ligase YbdK (ATP-grasp superfamily)